MYYKYILEAIGKWRMAEQQLNQAEILDALHAVIDPERSINVVDLSLVYGAEERDIDLIMAMTTPACRLHASISQAAEQAIRERARTRGHERSG
jgi:metal-sulfur cluster biosynthetic enzyme